MGVGVGAAPPPPLGRVKDCGSTKPPPGAIIRNKRSSAERLGGLIKLRNQLTEEKSEAKLSSVKNMLRIVHVVSAKLKFMEHYDN